MDGLVRVRETVGGREEIVRVGREYIEEYLESHPGAMAIDDWRAMPELRARATEARADDKEKGR